MREQTQNEDAEALIRCAEREIDRLNDGARWRMSIPADSRQDSDIIIQSALNAAREALSALRTEQTRLREALKMIQLAYTNDFRSPQLTSDAMVAIADAALSSTPTPEHSK